MKSTNFAPAVLLSLFVSGAVFADQSKVIVSGVSIKGGASAMAVDVVSAGNASAVSLAITLPGATDKTVDLSSCTSKLPKGWQAVCTMKGDTVRVGAFAPLDTAPLAAGLASIGEIRVKGIVGTASMSEVEIADSKGVVLSNSSDFSVQ